MAREAKIEGYFSHRKFIEAIESIEESESTAGEKLNLVLSDYCTDALPVFFDLQTTKNVESISVPWNFGLNKHSMKYFTGRFGRRETCGTTETYGKTKIGGGKTKIGGGKTTYEKIFSATEEMSLRTLQIGSELFLNEVEAIPGYSTYRTNLLFSSFVTNLPLDFKQIEFRKPPKGKESVFLFENGLVFSADRRILYFCLKSVNQNELFLPCETEIIAARAFYGCKGIRKIKLPKNLIFVDIDAFTNCGAKIEEAD